MSEKIRQVWDLLHKSPLVRAFPSTPSGLRPEPHQREFFPLETLLTLAAGQEGKALVFPLFERQRWGSSRVKAKPLSRSATPSLDTSSCPMSSIAVTTMQVQEVRAVPQPRRGEDKERAGRSPLPLAPSLPPTLSRKGQGLPLTLCHTASVGECRRQRAKPSN